MPVFQQGKGLLSRVNMKAKPEWESDSCQLRVTVVSVIGRPDPVESESVLSEANEPENAVTRVNCRRLHNLQLQSHPTPKDG
jgi:hypothetical protein